MDSYAPAGYRPADGLFNSFYEATSPLAFDVAAGLLGSAAASRVVAHAYEESLRRAQQGHRYHVVPLLRDIYRESSTYAEPSGLPGRPGMDAVAALTEPHRTLLHLTERHRFPLEHAAYIVGLSPAAAARAHEEARFVAHGVSAAIALAADGFPRCPVLAAMVDRTRPSAAQVEVIIAHAESCPICTEAALASPDPVRELRMSRVAQPLAALAPAMPARALPPASHPAHLRDAPASQRGPVTPPGAPEPARLTALPGKPQAMPSPAATAPAPVRVRSGPVAVWNQASLWQKAGVLVGLLLVVALVAAAVLGGPGGGEPGRTSGDVSRSDTGSVGAPGPVDTVAPSTTTAVPTSAPVVPDSTVAPPATSATPEPLPAPSTTAPTPPVTAPPPELHNASWGVTGTGVDLATNTMRYRVTFTWSSDATSSSYSTSWGVTQDVPAGSSQQTFEDMASGTHSLTLTVTGPGGSRTSTHNLALP